MDWAARTDVVRSARSGPHATDLHFFRVSRYLVRGPCLVVGPVRALRRQWTNTVVQLVPGPRTVGPVPSIRPQGTVPAMGTVIELDAGTVPGPLARGP